MNTPSLVEGERPVTVAPSQPGAARATASARGGSRESPWLGYVLSALLPPVILMVRLAMGFAPTDPLLSNLFLIPVALCAYLGGWRAGLAATVWSALLIDYFLVEPVWSLAIGDPKQRLTVLFFLVSGLFLTALIHRMLRAQARAEQTGTWLSVTLGCIGEAVITTDLDGKVTFLNAEAERLTGWTETMARGRELATILRVIDEQTWTPIVLPSSSSGAPSSAPAAGGGGKPAVRALMIARDGRETPIEESLAAIRELDGTTHGAVVVFRDCSEQRRKEAALRESEERARLFFEEGADPYFLHDEKGRIMEVNRRACESLGYTRAELLTLQVSDIAQEIDLDWLLQIWQTTKPGQSLPSGSHFHRRKDGSRFPVEVRMSCYSIRGGKVFLAAARDMTERVQAEKQVQRFREIVDDLPQMIWSSGPDGAIDYTNQGWTDYAGRREGEGWQPLIHPADWTKWSKAWAAAVATGEPSEMECRLREAATGEYRWHLGRALPLREAPGKIARWFGTWTDIHARKQSEEALQESEARFRQLVESMPQMVFMISAAGRKEYLSQAWHDFTGMDESEDVDANWKKYIHPEDFLHTMAIWRHGVKSAQPLTMEFRLREARTDGYRWVLARAVPILNDQGKILRWIGTCTNIDHQKSAQSDLQQARDTLEQRTGELAAVNKELEAFSYTVSHDLRAPVRAMDGFAQALLDDFGPELPDDGRRYVGIIRDSAHRMGLLIDDLLAFSQLGRTPMNKGPVDMSRLVTDSLEELGIRGGSSRLEIRLGKIPPCLGDRSLLKQVWMNLLSNALKYSGKRDHAVIEVGASVSAKETAYFVRDNGAGFDMRYIGKLFGVFQRLHHVREFEGTGVGLATVQRIINRHGGRIWAESVVDQGAIFSFTAAPAASAALGNPAAPVLP